MKTKKTKIICTMGPATDNPKVLEKMIKAGMNVARFNFSHGSYEDHEKRLNEVIEVRNRLSISQLPHCLIQKGLKSGLVILKIQRVRL